MTPRRGRVGESLQTDLEERDWLTGRREIAPDRFFRKVPTLKDLLGKTPPTPAPTPDRSAPAPGTPQTGRSVPARTCRAVTAEPTGRVKASARGGVTRTGNVCSVHAAIARELEAVARETAEQARRQERAHLHHFESESGLATGPFSCSCGAFRP